MKKIKRQWSNYKIKVFDFLDMPVTVRHAFNVVFSDLEPGECKDWMIGADPNEKYSVMVDKWLLRHGANKDEDQFVRIQY